MTDDLFQGVENPFKSLADNTLEPENEIKEPILDKSSEKRTVIPARNGGTLQPYNRRGRTFGQQQPSSTQKVRDAMRQGLAVVLPVLFEEIQSGKINKLQFADFLAKYSIGTTGTIALISPDVTRRLEQQVALIASRPTWEASELLEAMRDIWAS